MIWVFGIYVILNILFGSVVGILFGFTDIDISKYETTFTFAGYIICLIALILGLYLGLNEKLTGGNKSQSDTKD